MASPVLEHLLSKFADNTLGEEEKQQLAALLQQEANSQDIVDILQNKMLQEKTSEAFDEARFIPILKNLLRSDKPDKKGIVQHLRRPWLRYTAAAVLLVALATTISVIVQNNGKQQTQLTDKDQQAPAPGGHHAILTLSDGRKILLDSVKGNILQQDQLQVSNENGKLDYEGAAGKIENHTLSTPRGGQYQLRLPDGTQVWLNTASSISFPTSFKGGNRSVSITGEAYFEVKENKNMPFLVNVNNKASVEVLGTHFNVRSYPDESSIKTTLLEGKVKVSVAGNNSQSALLQPGEQASIRNEQIQVKQDIDPDAAVAWKGGLFDFSEADLPMVMRELSRWYDIEVRYEGPLPTDLYEGRIPMNASLGDVLKLLEKNNVRFRLEGKTLTVLTGKNK